MSEDENFILHWSEDIAEIFTNLIKIYKGMISHDGQEDLQDILISEEQVRNCILNLLEYICKLSLYYDFEYGNCENGNDTKAIGTIITCIESYLETLMIHDELFENSFMLEESLNPIRGIGRVKFMQIPSFTQARLAKYCEFILDRNNPYIDQQTQNRLDLLILISYETCQFQDQQNSNLVNEIRELPKNIINNEIESLACSFTFIFRICIDLLERDIHSLAFSKFKSFLISLFIKNSFDESVNILFRKIWEELDLKLENITSLIDLFLMFSIHSLKKCKDEEILKEEIKSTFLLVKSFKSTLHTNSNNCQAKIIKSGNFEVNNEILNDIIKIQLFKDSLMLFCEDNHSSVWCRIRSKFMGIIVKCVFLLATKTVDPTLATLKNQYCNVDCLKETEDTEQNFKSFIMLINQIQGFFLGVQKAEEFKSVFRVMHSD